MIGTSGGNGIIEARFDLVGMSYLFGDWDIDGGGNGTKAAEDGIVLAKWY